jgi:TRAP-type C4-dicarboxylate transport system substrate-binding protein
MSPFKKVLMLAIAFILVLIPALSGGKGETAAKETAKPVTLRLSTHHPPDVSRSVGSRLLKEEIEKATHGMIKIDIYYSESIAKGREVLDAAKDGVVDIADLNPAYYPGQLPLHASVVVFTKAPPKHRQKKEVVEKTYKKYPKYLNEIEKYNQKILWQYFPGSLNLSSTKSVKSLRDFRGLKIRASTEVYLRMLKDIGAIPVSVPFTDCYMALQTRTIDGVFTNIEAMTGQKFYEPAPYSFTSEKLGLWVPFTFTINKNKWNSFSPVIQDQIMKAVARVDERFGPLYDEAYAAEVKIFRERGKELVMASDEDVHTWQNLPILKQLKKELAEKAEKAGFPNGMQFVDDIERFMEEAAKK